MAIPDASTSIPYTTMQSRKSQVTSYISVILLFFINLINYMDRYTLAGVLPEVKHYYNNLSDGSLGLLQTAFVASYMVAAPVFGYMGDRMSRKLIIVAGILFWSVTTLLGSFVPPNYYGLFLGLRGLVGVGEASYSTIAPTIIADLFSHGRRTTMLAVFYFAIPLGSGLGYIVGASVSKLFDHQWYWALRVTPLLGVVLVILTLFFLKDPPRGEADGSTADGATLVPTSILQDLRDLISNMSFVWSSVGFTCVAFAIGSLAWWAPTFMINALNLGQAQADEQTVTLVFGAITCFGGILGIVIGSQMSRYLKERLNTPRCDPLICAVSLIVAVPLLFMSCTFASKWPIGSWFLMFMAVTSLCCNWSIISDIVMYTVVPTRRSLAQALQILFSHLLGDASSPYIIGAISDAVRGDQTSLVMKFVSLQYAMYLPLFVLVLGSFSFLVCSSHVEGDQRRCLHISQGSLSSPINGVHPAPVFYPPSPVANLPAS